MVRNILVTGANKGIGLAIVLRCLQDHGDTHVIMASRSRERCEAACAKVTKDQPEWKDRLTVLEIDASSDQSVKAAAESLKLKPLYGIVNNAGIAAGATSEVLNVNVRGPKRVNDAFLPVLDKEQGRIVHVSSGAASMCVSRCSPEKKKFFIDPNVTFEQIENLMEKVEKSAAENGGKPNLKAEGIGGDFVYGLSKALLNSYTMVMAREHPNIKTNSCSPGMIATDILSSALPWWLPIPGGVVKFAASKLIGAKTPDEGTVSTMHLLFHEPLEGNGRYYGSDAQRSPLDEYRSPGSPPYEGP